MLEGLLEVLPNKSIAYDLEISPRTAEIHRARVMDKMGARSLSELIRLALAAGGPPRVPGVTPGPRFRRGDEQVLPRAHPGRRSQGLLPRRIRTTTGVAPADQAREPQLLR